MVKNYNNVKRRKNVEYSKNNNWFDVFNINIESVRIF